MYLFGFAWRSANKLVSDAAASLRLTYNVSSVESRPSVPSPRSMRSRMTVSDAVAWADTLGGVLNEREMAIARMVNKEIGGRLGFLADVGLDYLTIDRTSSTLSGGEAQRIRLATQIGSGLQGVLYVCDEPSIGLHPADDHRLIATLKRLRDLGNTVIIVEHDEAIMRAADHIVDRYLNVHDSLPERVRALDSRVVVEAYFADVADGCVGFEGVAI